MGTNRAATRGGRLKGALRSIGEPAKFLVFEIAFILIVSLIVAFYLRMAAPSVKYEALEIILKAVIDVSGVAIGLTGVVSAFLLSSMAHDKRDAMRYVRELKSRLSESPEKAKQLEAIISNEKKELDTITRKSVYLILCIFLCVLTFVLASTSCIMNLTKIGPDIREYSTIDYLAYPIEFLMIGFAFLIAVVLYGSVSVLSWPTASENP